MIADATQSTTFHMANSPDEVQLLRMFRLVNGKVKDIVMYLLSGFVADMRLEQGKKVHQLQVIKGGKV